MKERVACLAERDQVVKFIPPRNPPMQCNDVVKIDGENAPAGRNSAPVT